MHRCITMLHPTVAVKPAVAVPQGSRRTGCRGAGPLGPRRRPPHAPGVHPSHPRRTRRGARLRLPSPPHGQPNMPGLLHERLARKETRERRGALLGDVLPRGVLDRRRALRAVAIPADRQIDVEGPLARLVEQDERVLGDHLEHLAALDDRRLDLAPTAIGSEAGRTRPGLFDTQTAFSFPVAVFSSRISSMAARGWSMRCWSAPHASPTPSPVSRRACGRESHPATAPAQPACPPRG